MNYYIELQLLPEDEVNLGYIWQKVFQQVHFALVEHGYESGRTLKMQDGSIKILKNSKIAVSFPEYQNHAFPLGSKLRLFAQTQSQLEVLEIQTWLNRFTDYVAVGAIAEVPTNASQIVFKQKRVKGVKRLAKAFERKREYLANKFGTEFDPNHDKVNWPGDFQKEELPFIQLESQTTKKNRGSGLFHIFIEKLVCNKGGNAEFDCYGLAISQTATVPWF